jgi:hypothetical protein
MQLAEINFLRRSNSKFAFTLPRRNMAKTPKEILDQLEPTWLQWRRRLDLPFAFSFTAKKGCHLAKKSVI